MKKCLSVFVKTILAVLAALCVLTQLSACRYATPAPVEDAEIGSVITFGHFEQDNNEANGKEPIEWKVLDKKDGKLLVISKAVLISKSYNDALEVTSWENCSLRKWLNDEFMQTAFNKSEQMSIAVTVCPADKNPEYKTNQGNDTEDKLFLLSYDEFERYYDVVEADAAATEYAIQNGAIIDHLVGNNHTYWWLRTLGRVGYMATYGNVHSLLIDETKGFSVVREGYGVRPAMWLNVSE